MRRPFAICALAALAGAPLLLGAGSDRSLIRQLDNEVIALRQRVWMLEEHCGSEEKPPAIFGELVQVFGGTPVSISRQGGRALITLRMDDLFSLGSLTVREEVQPSLDLLATALAVNSETNLVIVGHSDGSPAPEALRARYPSDWEWSMAMAQAVSEQLIRYGVQPGRITLGSRGPWDPLVSNDNPEGRAMNRRVVIHLSEGKYP